MIVADPMSMPVTCGCVFDAVAPAAIKMLVGEIVTSDELLLMSVTVMPPAGAGDPNKTGNGAMPFLVTVILDGRVIFVCAATLILTVAEVMLGDDEVAWIAVAPGFTLVAAKLTPVVFAGIVTLGGTVITFALSEVRVTVWAVDSGDDRVKKSCWLAP